MTDKLTTLLKSNARMWQVYRLVAQHKAGRISYMALRKQCSLDEIKAGNMVISAILNRSKA